MTASLHLRRLAAATVLALAGMGAGVVALPAGSADRETSVEAHAVRLAPASSGPVSAAARVARTRDAEAARWSTQAAAFAAAQHADARAVAVAAVRAAETAASLPGAPAEALTGLQGAREALLSLTGSAPVPAFRTDEAGPPRRPVETEAMTQLLTAGELSSGASELFALAFGVEEAAYEAASAPEKSGPGLEAVEEAAAVAKALAADFDLDLGLAEVPELDLAALDFPWPNGAIPDSELCAPRSAPGHRLQCEAAEAFDRMADAYLAATGKVLGVNSSYRTYEDQVEVKRMRGWLAARPGTSMHGRGLALDLAEMGGLGQFDRPAYLWMKENAGRFGWYHPKAMEPGGSGPPEPWHWEFKPTAADD